jgi:hypothetical protein
MESLDTDRLLRQQGCAVHQFQGAQEAGMLSVRLFRNAAAFLQGDPAGSLAKSDFAFLPSAMEALGAGASAEIQTRGSRIV